MTAVLRAVNVTVLFEDIPESFSLEKIRESLKEAFGEGRKIGVIEAPGALIIQSEENKKHLVIEGNRFRISDLSGQDVNTSDVLKDFWIFYNSIFKKFKMTAYGFNYDFELSSDSEPDISHYLENRLQTMIDGTIKGFGLVLQYEKNNTRYQYELTPTASNQIHTFHMNAHYTSQEVPSESDLRKVFLESYQEAKKISGLL